MAGLVTGAADGVGSLAVSLLASPRLPRRRRDRPSRGGRLPAPLGAAEVIERAELVADPRPLAKERWTRHGGHAGRRGTRQPAFDDRLRRRGGGLRRCRQDGDDGRERCALHLSRRDALRHRVGARLALALEEAWNRLSEEIDREVLASMTQANGVDEVMAAARAVVEGRMRGRTVVLVAPGVAANGG